MGSAEEGRQPIAWPGLATVSLVFVAVLIGTSGGYGYHRDELYFIVIGGHPDLGYVDQPPLVPLLAHALDATLDGSLVWLRVPSALAGALCVLTTGLMARELGGRTGAQVLAASSYAVSAIAMASSHLLSTTSFDLLSWTVITWLFIRAVRDGGPTWLLLGLVAGVGLQTKTLVVFLLLALTIGLLTVGPRLVFRSRWPWLAALVAVAVWAPNLWWQATNGWPQLELSRAIASGRSGTSEPRWLFLPYQLVLISPVLVPVWVAGWWRLARSRQMAIWRAIPAAYVVLALVFIASGGKPYYLCGLYPALLAAGAEPVLAWTGRGWLRVRSVFLGAALVMSLAISMVLFLPVVPVGRLAGTPVVDINYDAGETVGWPALAATIATSYDALPRDEQLHAIVLTSNYGEAGAVMRFRPEVGPVFSGQNSLYDLGPPPADTETVIAVGYDETDLRAWFARVRQEAQVDNGVDVDNDEQGTRVWVCGDPRLPWTALWSQLRRLG